MSQILLINGVLNILICGLFLFHTNKYRYLMTKTRLVILSITSLYFLFLGFLRVKTSLEINIWNDFEYSKNRVFKIIPNSISSVAIIVFLYSSIRFKGKIIKDENND